MIWGWNVFVRCYCTVTGPKNTYCRIEMWLQFCVRFHQRWTSKFPGEREKERAKENRSRKYFITHLSLSLDVNKTCKLQHGDSVKRQTATCVTGMWAEVFRNHPHFMWWQPQQRIPQLWDSWHSTTPPSVPNAQSHSLTQNQPLINTGEIMTAHGWLKNRDVRCITRSQNKQACVTEADRRCTRLERSVIYAPHRDGCAKTKRRQIK